MRSGMRVAMVSLVLVGCGESPPPDVSATSSAIVEGNVVASANPPDNPGTVIVYLDSQGSYCSGTLIRKRWVLTADHCVHTDKNNPSSPLRLPSDISVLRAVSPGRIRPPGTIAATHIVYSGKIGAFTDASLLRLSAPLPNPVGFWNGDGPELAFSFVRAMGYGLNDELGGQGGGTLRWADLMVSAVEQIPARLTLSYNGSQTTTLGDSGGPSYVFMDRFGRQVPGVAGIHNMTAGALGAYDGSVRAFSAVAKTGMYNGGDVHGDRKADFLLTGGSGWTTIPVARSNGNGTFQLQNPAVPNFPAWATTSMARALSGDFDGDGAADVALTGPAGWASIPIAFSNRTDPVGFRVVNVISGAGQFPIFASQGGAQPIAGDFDGDGLTDIAAAGGGGWTTVPVAFSNGDGTFTVKNTPGGAGADFPNWAQAPGVRVIAGDFDGDGRDDIALTGVVGWGTVPVAFSNGDGTFLVTNKAAQNFTTWAQEGGLRFVCGDFDANGRDDILAIGATTWTNVRFAMSAGDGSFRAATASVHSSFPPLARNTAQRPLAIDVNGDSRTDIALVGGSGWNYVPVLLNTGNPGFADAPVIATNASLASLAQASGSKKVGGH